MIILLPPSETKTRPPEAGASRFAEMLDRQDRAPFSPALLTARRTMARAVERTAASRDGAAALGVPVSAPHLRERMVHLGEEPVAPPLRVYAGVLYDQLGDAAPGPDRRVVVQSALLGVADAEADLIPAYRVSATSRLQRLGTAAGWWRPHLARVAADLMREAAASPSPLVVDARSGAYRAMMPLPAHPDAPVLDVTPLRERAGVRSVVSHDAKRYRGWVVRVLLEHPRPLAGADSVRALLTEAAARDAAGAHPEDALAVRIEGRRLVIVDRGDPRG